MKARRCALHIAHAGPHMWIDTTRTTPLLGECEVRAPADAEKSAVPLNANGRTWADEASRSSWELVPSPDDARPYTVEGRHYLIRHPGRSAHLAIVAHPIHNARGFAAAARLMASGPRLARALEALLESQGVATRDEAIAALAEARSAA